MTDKKMYYGENTYGFPAFKHFKHPTNSKWHYLLIFGGCSTDKKALSKNVVVFKVIIGDKLEKADEVKISFIKAIEQKPLP